MRDAIPAMTPVQPRVRPRIGHTRWRPAVGMAVAVLVVAVLSVAAVILLWRPVNRVQQAGFAEQTGRSFTVNGSPFRPIGVNFYSAAGDPSIFECGPRHRDPDAEIDDAFRRLRTESGANVVRFWAFQSYTAGGTDWRAIDRVLRLARAHGLLVIPVLENQWADCTLGGPRDAGWYAGRFRQPDSGYPLAYQEYVRQIVTRYRDDPTIFAWMLMNEAEAKRPDGSGDSEALYTFAREMSQQVKTLDPQHLVALGVIGRGQPGTAGADFELLHALPSLDMVTYHDYHAEDAPLPGARIDVAGYRQAADWSWSNGTYRSLLGQSWETVSYQLPTTTQSGQSGGQQAPRRIGLTLFGDFAGDLYVDQIRVGSRVYDFEDGTAQGWQVAGVSAPEVSNARAASGRTALRLRLSRPDAGVQLWLDPPSNLEPGATITASVYLETPGVSLPGTMAAAVTTAATLNKPLLVSESGILTCSAPVAGSPVFAPDARAARFEAKLDAFFRAGGAGYLVWAWDRESSCGYDFTGGDPLNAVLMKWSSLAAPILPSGSGTTRLGVTSPPAR